MILDLIGGIYDAAAKAELWPVFLERFADSIGSTTTIFFFKDQSHANASLLAETRGDPNWWLRFAEYYAAIDPWAAGGFRLGLNAGTVATGEFLCPTRLLEKTEFCNDFLLKGDVFHQVCGVVLRGHMNASVISCMRPRRAGPFSEESTRLFELLMPHLERALQLHTRIAGLENQANSAHEALDRIPIGFLLLERTGKVLLLNRSAREIANKNDGLSLGRDGLAANLAEEGNRLRGLIGAATATGLGEGVSSGGTLTIQRPSGRRAFQVLVTPLRSRTSSLWPETAAAAVFVSDPENQPEPAAKILQRLFDLTGAEARLAAALMEGKSLEETAAEFRVSRNTVRAQLRSVFGKTGTSRQGELIRLLWNSPAQLKLD